MNKPSRRAQKIMAAAATPVALVALGGMVYQASYAAFTAAWKLATSSVSSAPATASDKIVSRDTTLKSSPVMNV